MVDDLSDIAEVLGGKNGLLMHVHVNELIMCVNSRDQNNNSSSGMTAPQPSHPFIRDISDDEANQITELSFSSQSNCEVLMACQRF